MKRFLPLILPLFTALVGYMFTFQPWEYDGPMRVKGDTVTIHRSLVDAAKPWEGQGVEFVVSDSPMVDVTRGRLAGMAGAEATRTFTRGNYIASCRIKVDGKMDQRIMTHEFGHCLGLTHEHAHAGEGTNMYRMAGAYQDGWSDTVTDWDRKNLANLYGMR